MPSPTVGASDRIRISRAGWAGLRDDSGRATLISALYLAARATVAQDTNGNGVLPSAQRRISNPRGFQGSSSCPALCRASTSSFFAVKQDVDGRDEPGHDGIERGISWRPTN